MSFCNEGQTCEPKVCKEPSTAENAKITLGSPEKNLILGSKAQLQCDEGFVYDLSDSMIAVDVELICIDDGEHKGHIHWAEVEIGAEYRGCRKGY